MMQKHRTIPTTTNSSPFTTTLNITNFSWASCLGQTNELVILIAKKTMFTMANDPTTYFLTRTMQTQFRN